MTINSEAAARDLLDHAGWHEVRDDIVREARAARATIFGQEFETAEAQGLATARARGTLRVLKYVIVALYKRANKKPPDEIENLFQ